jgi:hypothetical protein
LTKTQCRQWGSECELSFEVSCLFFLFWFFSRRVDPGSARLKKGKKVPEEKLPGLTPVPDGPEF